MFGEWAEMNRIRDDIYLGSAQAESGPLERLQEVGISHVVQVGTGDFMSPTHHGHLTYCTIQALDHEGEDLLAKIKQAKVHSFMDQACAGGGKVLVHCFAGVSRSATTVISYLMAREGLSFENALVDLVSKRSCVAPNRGFCDQLRILQNRCDGQLERYCHRMLQEHKDELTMKQWLALLMRAKDKVNGSLFGVELAAKEGGSLGVVKQRLEERKKLAAEGKYKGEMPPPEDVKAVESHAPKATSEEYGLGLA